MRPGLRVGLLKLTIFHAKNSVSRLDKAVVMSDDDDCRFPVGAELSQQSKNLGTGSRIELAGWFVSQHKFWLLEQRSRNRNALLLAAGKLMWAMIEPVTQPDLLEHFNGSVTKLGRDVLRKVRNQCVVDGVEIVQQVEALKDEPDIVTAIGVPFGIRQSRKRAIFEQNLARRWLVERPNQVQQAALSAARRSEDEVKHASLDRAGHASQSMNVGLAFDVRFGDVLNLDHGSSFEAAVSLIVDLRSFLLSRRRQTVPPVAASSSQIESSNASESLASSVVMVIGGLTRSTLPASGPRK